MHSVILQFIRIYKAAAFKRIKLEILALVYSCTTALPSERPFFENYFHTSPRSDSIFRYKPYEFICQIFSLGFSDGTNHSPINEEKVKLRDRDATLNPHNKRLHPFL